MTICSPFAKWSTTSLVALSTCARSLTSHFTPSERSPRPRSSPRRDSSPTLAPASCSLRATDAPIPPLAPVTSATFPSSWLIGLLLSCADRHPGDLVSLDLERERARAVEALAAHVGRDDGLVSALYDVSDHEGHLDAYELSVAPSFDPVGALKFAPPVIDHPVLGEAREERLGVVPVGCVEDRLDRLRDGSHRRVRPYVTCERSVSRAPTPRKSSSAPLSSSGCVQPMLWGPPSTGTSVRSSIRSGRRFAVASNGRIRSSVPCTTSTGTSIFATSSRKSSSHVATHAYDAYGEAAAATLKLACHACSLMRVPPSLSTL